MAAAGREAERRRQQGVRQGSGRKAHPAFKLQYALPHDTLHASLTHIGPQVVAGV